MNCAGCALEIEDREGYGCVSYGWGDTPLEKLQSYQSYHYCGECMKALRAQLGLPEPIPIPDPPFSCADPRLVF